MKLIYITGVARSGTTLLARMFHSFEGVYVINEECNIYDFSNCLSNKIIVGKRTENSIFSNILSNREIKNQLNLMNKKNIFIINCVRDGRDVVESWVKAWELYNPFAWMSGILQSEKYKNKIKITVKYEELINNPDKIQNEIMKLTGLEKNFLFSEYPKFVPEESFKSTDEKYKLRGLELEKKISKEYLNEPNDIITFLRLNKKLGYE